MDYVIFTLFIAVIIFLICREIFCWYWKINGIVSLLERIDSRLVVLLEQSAPPKDPALSSIIELPPKTPPQFSTAEIKNSPEVIPCPECGKSIVVKHLRIGDNGLTKCPHCSGYFNVQMD